MSVTTINSFPAFHSLTSPRGWALALIVLLHVGFFWALSNGLSHSIITILKPPLIATVIDEVKPTPPPPKPIDFEVRNEVYVPPIDQPNRIDFEESETALVVNTTPVPPVVDRPGSAIEPEPVVVAPRIDPRRGLTEPFYPPDQIRQEHEGTVMVAVYVLANGRVGDVRLEKSSGWTKLDESALKEARTWRLLPGTRNGVAVAAWKVVPVTFRLNN